MITIKLKHFNLVTTATTTTTTTTLV